MKIKFRPKKDITAYELAIIYGNIVTSGPTCISKTWIHIEDKQYNRLDERIKKHFIINRDKLEPK